MSKNIIILGAGYAGIEAAKKLNNLLKKEPEATITLINNKPYHTLLTELHEVAGNRIGSEGVMISLEELFDYTRVNIVEDFIEDIDFDNKLLKSENYEYNYDYLIMGTGSEPTDCGVEGAKDNSFSLWSLEDAKKINKHIKDCFQKASITKNSIIRKELLSFVIAGGGFTGVEMLGELIEWIDELCYQYDIPRNEISLYLSEGLDNILPSIDKDLADRVIAYLRKKGVNLKLGSFIQKIHKNGLSLTNGKEIACRTVIWNCGVRASDTATASELKADSAGRIEVNEYLQTVEHPEVYAVGDNAATPWGNDDKILPALVEAALQTGKTAAVNIVADIKGTTKEKITPKFHGIMVSIGSKFAVADLMGLKLKGWPAMFMKHMVNIHYLTGIGGLKNGIKYTFDYIKEQGSPKGVVSQGFDHFSQKGYSFLFAFLRIFLGFQWLLSGLDKVNNGWLAYGDKLVAGASTSPIGPNPIAWYVGFMEAVVFPNAFLFQYMITLGEIALAISLILGIIVPLGALGSVFMSINFFLSGFYPENQTLPWWLISSIACIGAGRALSVDYYLIPWLKKLFWGRRKGKKQDLGKIVKEKKKNPNEN